jgi:hypothetical protein
MSLRIAEVSRHDVVACQATCSKEKGQKEGQQKSEVGHEGDSESQGKS